MTTNNHPITPPPELVQQWVDRPLPTKKILVIASQWGADQELEACVELWANNSIKWTSSQFREARRHKPLSLKEQALALVEQHEDGWRPSPKDWDTIRKALESLDD